MPFEFLGIGALYEDIILTLPHYPQEDSKLRATSRKSRLGGNIANALSVLSQAAAALPSGGGGGEDGSWVGVLFAACRGDSFFKERLSKMGCFEWGVEKEQCVTRPTAYILETGGSRTIVSYTDLPELTLPEIVSTLTSFPNPPTWLHIEGRNCKTISELFPTTGMIHKLKDTTISIDFERPNRPGLQELLPYADIAFISKCYAIACITTASAAASAGGGDDDAYGDGEKMGDEEIITKFLGDGIAGRALKASAVGYVTFGEGGCYVFMNVFSKHYSQSLAAHENVIEVDGKWAYLHLPAPPLPGPVVETIGAGDTFFAAVVYALGVKRTGVVEAGRIGNRVAGRKCGRVGFEGVWEGEGL